MSSAIDKALLVLETVVARSGPKSLSEIGARTGLTRQAVFRILQQLEANGLLQREPLEGRYLVGRRMASLAFETLTTNQRTSGAHEILKGLVAEVGETSNVGILDGREILYLDRVECDWPLRLQLQPGSRIPSHCSAIGKLLLAFLPARSRDRLLQRRPLVRHTPKTVVDRSTLLKQLRQIRREGVAVNDQEFALGLLGIAVPIYGPQNRVVAGLAIHAPTARMDESQARRYLPALKAAAADLSSTYQTVLDPEARP